MRRRRARRRLARSRRCRIYSIRHYFLSFSIIHDSNRTEPVCYLAQRDTGGRMRRGEREAKAARRLFGDSVSVVRCHMYAMCSSTEHVTRQHRL
jgi:hypothetical protein